MRTVAIFNSNKFNLSESRNYLINPYCYGDDLGKWLIRKLREIGIETDKEPAQEDFGWYFDYTVDGIKFCAVIGNIYAEKWFMVVERSTGIIGTIIGGRNRSVGDSGVRVIHKILSTSEEINNLMWHRWKDFRNKGIYNFNNGSLLPSAP